MNVSIEPNSTRARISRCKAKAQDINSGQQQPQGKRISVEQQEFSQVFQEYQDALVASNLLDYDDLLLRCAELLRAHPRCVSNIEAVLIDEFQDTNIIQLELMKLLASKNRRVTIVGDPDQSIYGFRSAEIQNLSRMQQYYPDTSVIHLEENYRSSGAILRCAQEVIAQDVTRPNKQFKATHRYGPLPVLRRLPSAHDEARWVVAEIRRMKAMTGKLTTFSDYAILLRSAHLSLLIETALGKLGIPYRMVGGYRFFDREEIRTLLDYLRTISQPNNNAALSAVVNVPSRKIGEESLRELLRLADDKGLSLWAVVQKITQGDLTMKKKLSRPAEQNLCKLVSLIKEARKKMANVTPESTPKFLLEFCIKQLAYKEYLQSKHPEEHESRWANVEELLSQAADIAQSGANVDGAAPDESLPDIEGLEKQQLDGNDEALASFLANITLSSDLQAAADGQEQECVTISTIHSAKGLEWPIVFIPAVYEGSIPHSRAEDTDEERRLLYVAMTRAKALLYLTHPLRQSRGDTDTTLSSFLPPKSHKYCVQIGPDVTDKVIRDVAHILRRPIPSQEELIKGMESLSDRESSQDNLWPADGSAKPRQWWDFEESNPVPKKPRFETVRVEGINIPQGHIDMQDASFNAEKRRNGPVVDHAPAFTTAAQFVEVHGFSQSEDGYKREPTEPPSQNLSTIARSRKKRGRPVAGQGTIANFFNRGSARATCPPSTSKLPPEPELPSHFNAPAQPASHKIPTTFTSHRVSAKPASLKRPQPLQELSNSKQNEYVFLSSSPTREGPSLEPQKAPHTIVTGTAASHPTHYTPSSVPVTSMHNTSVDIVRQQSTMLGRRTYGVQRRMMNGWENRKHK